MFQRISMTTTSLHNVVISNDSDMIYYDVITPKWEPHLTMIKRLDPNTQALYVVGEVRKEDNRKTVRVHGGDIRPAEDFLRMEDSGTRARNIGSARFKGKNGINYMWRTRKGQLELIQEDRPNETPVAVYYRQKRYFFILKMSRQPYIDIDASVIETLDTLILSFLLVERRRRHSSE